jgi:hypothetical protein
VAKLVYTPVGILAGMLAGFLATRLFELIWKRISDEPPAEPDDRAGSWVEVVGAAAIKGAIFGGTRALIQRGGAKSFERATGAWPGDEGRG